MLFQNEKNKRSILIVGYGQDGKILHEKSLKKGMEVFIMEIRISNHIKRK